ncbi:UNVERIFIED_CONTAM: hypothetical protein Slati_1333300 [Sesamum latifolium]|uniref:Reverse transcriptase domain-containing protein n=1 Tax=Sesamum latifolium TaxID=2727402 RepID=A0AAW2XHB2_9LAMI
MQLVDSINDDLWLVMDDFNTVVDLSEVSSASGNIRGAMEEFQECITATGLITLPIQGQFFTWHNCSNDSRSLWKRLDRMMVNDRWLDRWLQAFYTSLNPQTSDHSPLVLKGNVHNPHPTLFRFDNYLTASPKFLPAVRNVWSHPIVGTTMYAVTRKLKALKPVFRQQRKKKAPASVSDFRPISCCNVLYKAITKIIVQRMREVLDRLISPNACRAYDMVEWDFLFATMQMFGFSDLFIRWVEECVTTPTFSIGINGTDHGFFKGGRGLRQGLFQLGFADDLLLFCEATDSSIAVFQRGLDEFATLSGLHVNPGKSHLILSKAAQVHRTRLLEVLGFQEGHLPVRYLGLPLISSRLTLADCRPILMKIDGQIRGWGGLSLSFVARVQLIKSVLTAISIYWVMPFILPKGIIREIEKRLRASLLKGVANAGYPKVEWSQVCKPVNEGGMGVREIGALNLAMISRCLWEVVIRNRDSL